MDKHLEYRADTQTLLGQKMRHLVDTETGEKIDVNQVTKRAYGQKAFWKVYLMDFLQILGILDSKQIDVLIYILERTEPANNTFIGSQRDIAKGAGASLDTVSRIASHLGIDAIELFKEKDEVELYAKYHGKLYPITNEDLISIISKKE